MYILILKKRLIHTGNQTNTKTYWHMVFSANHCDRKQPLEVLLLYNQLV